MSFDYSKDYIKYRKKSKRFCRRLTRKADTRKGRLWHRYGEIEKRRRRINFTRRVYDFTSRGPCWDHFYVCGSIILYLPVYLAKLLNLKYADSTYFAMQRTIWSLMIFAHAWVRRGAAFIHDANENDINPCSIGPSILVPEYCEGMWNDKYMLRYKERFMEGQTPTEYFFLFELPWWVWARLDDWTTDWDLVCKCAVYGESNEFVLNTKFLSSLNRWSKLYRSYRRIQKPEWIYPRRYFLFNERLLRHKRRNLINGERKFKHGMKKLRHRFYYFYGWFFTFSPVVVWWVCGRYREAVHRRMTKHRFVGVAKKAVQFVWKAFLKKSSRLVDNKYLSLFLQESNTKLRIPYKTILCIFFLLILLLF